MLNRVLLLSFACGVAGCSGSASVPTAPTPTPAAQVMQPTATELRGFVMDTAYRNLEGARIEVMDGPSAGTAAIAGADGQFVLSGLFNETTRFRAVMDGHETRTQVWNCSVTTGCPGANGARPWLGFYLTVLAPSVNIAGTYTLTFTADSACADFPEAMRTRSYRAVVTAQAIDDRSTIPGFVLTIEGTPVAGHMDGFPIGVAGDRLNLWLHGGHDPAIVEDLGGNSYLAFSGGAVTLGTAGPSTIATRFEGWIEHIVLAAPLVGPWYYPQAATISKSTCESANHRLTLTSAP